MGLKVPKLDSKAFGSLLGLAALGLATGGFGPAAAAAAPAAGGAAAGGGMAPALLPSGLAAGEAGVAGGLPAALQASQAAGAVAMPAQQALSQSLGGEAMRAPASVGQLGAGGPGVNAIPSPDLVSPQAPSGIESVGQKTPIAEKSIFGDGTKPPIDTKLPPKDEQSALAKFLETRGGGMIGAAGIQGLGSMLSGLAQAEAAAQMAEAEAKIEAAKMRQQGAQSQAQLLASGTARGTQDILATLSRALG